MRWSLCTRDRLGHALAEIGQQPAEGMVRALCGAEFPQVAGIEPHPLRCAPMCRSCGALVVRGAVGSPAFPLPSRGGRDHPRDETRPVAG